MRSVALVCVWAKFMEDTWNLQSVWNVKRFVNNIFKINKIFFDVSNRINQIIFVIHKQTLKMGWLLLQSIRFRGYVHLSMKLLTINMEFMVDRNGVCLMNKNDLRNDIMLRNTIFHDNEGIYAVLARAVQWHFSVQ